MKGNYPFFIAKKLCPNCGKKLIKLEQDTLEDEGFPKTVVKYIHQYEDFCEDIIDFEYYQTRNQSQIDYFNFLRELYKVVVAV